MNINNKLVLL